MGSKPIWIGVTGEEWLLIGDRLEELGSGWAPVFRAHAKRWMQWEEGMPDVVMVTRDRRCSPRVKRHWKVPEVQRYLFEVRGYGPDDLIGVLLDEEKHKNRVSPGAVLVLS